MSVVQNVVCDGCTVQVPSTGPRHVVSVVSMVGGEVTTRHYGLDLCQCGDQVQKFLNDLAERRGVAPETPSVPAE